MRYGHIAPEKLESIVKECDTLSSWLTDMQAHRAAATGSAGVPCDGFGRERGCPLKRSMLGKQGISC